MAHVVAVALLRHIAILYALGDGSYKGKLFKAQENDYFCATILSTKNQGMIHSCHDSYVPLPQFSKKNCVLVRVTLLSSKY